MSFQHLCTITLVLCFTFTAHSAPTFGHQIARRNTESDPAPVIKVITEGHDVVLDCSADGISPPIIHWMFDGEYVEQGPWDTQARNLIPPPVPETAVEGEDLHFTESTFLIESATQADAGKYTCVADTQSQRKTKSFIVRVEPAPADHGERNKRQSEVNPVRIYMWSAQVYENQGGDTTLICRATQGATKSPPTIRWELDGHVIDGNTRGFKVLSNGDLQFEATASLHLADLKCTAIGDTGTVDSKEPFLYIYEPSEVSDLSTL